MNYKEEFYEFYREKFNKDSATSKDTLIVFDTNALLNVFRFTPDASDLYFKIINDVKEWMYVPYLVAIEFHFNKKKTLTENDNNVKRFKEKFDNNWRNIGSNFSKGIFSSFSFRDGSKESNDNFERELAKLLMESINKNKKEIEVKTIEKFETISTQQSEKFTSLINLMEVKTRERYTQKFINEVQEEGKYRYKLEVPPGYDDNGKNGIRKFNDISYERKYGDLIIWKDILEKAKEPEINNVIFITSDGKSDKKNDLLYKVNDLTIGARVEMIEEMWKESKANFFIMNELEFIGAFSDMKVPKTISKSIEIYYSKETNKNIRRADYSNIIDSDDLENILNSSNELEAELEESLNDFLLNETFELDEPYYIHGWGELEHFTIQDTYIEKSDLIFDFDSISGTAVVECDVDFNVIYKNPMYEKGHDDEEETSYTGQNEMYSVSIEFYYTRSEKSLDIQVTSIDG